MVAALVVAALMPGAVSAADRPTAAAPAPGSAAERQARGEVAAKAFVLGQYEEALAIYLDLYVQSGGRPEYLRNIGRCQQKLKRYDRAIDSFKDYLKRAKRLSVEERREVEAFIAEMEAAAAKAAEAPPASVARGAEVPSPSTTVAARAVATPAPAAAPPVAATAPTPPPSPVPAQPHGLAPAPPGIATAPLPTPDPYPAPPPPPSGPRRMTIASVVVTVAAAALAIGATAALLSARSTYAEAERAGCKTTWSPTCEDRANEVETASVISKVLFVGAGLAGATGVALFLLAPPAKAEPSGQAAYGVQARWTF